MISPQKTIALLITASCMSCSAPAPHEKADPTPSQEPVASSVRCFRSVTTSGDGTYSDTMSITLQINNSQVEGRMDWLPGMKDKMRGTLNGTLENGLISALYTYSSEGVRQSEERMFKLRDDQITVMSGEMEERDGTMVMKDPANAVDGIQVPEVDC